MKINIFQIAPERDTNEVIYVDSQYLRQHQGNTAIDSSIYDKVYSCEIECNNLEDIFAKFNISVPSDYRGRSISISDVIEVVENSEVKKGFYYCNSFGFKKINFDSSKTQDKTNFDGLTVLHIQPMHPPRIVTIPNELKAMQNLVDGYIEEYYPFDDNAVIICNEEGKINGLRLNRAIYSAPDDNGDKQIKEIIAGPFFICAAPVDSENYQSLSEEQLKKYGEMFKNPERFYFQGNDIKVYPIELKPKDYER